MTMKLHEILIEVRNRLLDSGDYGSGWSATADATAIGQAADRIRELETALRGIAQDYVCIGVRNVHTGACVGCPVCDARDALATAETAADPKYVAPQSDRAGKQ